MGSDRIDALHRRRFQLRRQIEISRLGIIAGLFALLIMAAAGCGDSEPETITDSCLPSDDPRGNLERDRFSQRVYWLGERLAIPASPALEFNGSYIDYRYGSETINEDSGLIITYNSLSLEQWYRPEWEECLQQFTGYDPKIVYPGGPINWWQHPCIEEEVYQEANGAEVHLFKAHLPSLIYIYPMNTAEVNQCLNEPVGAFGAHVYFESTVVTISVQDSIGPASLATTQVVTPDVTSTAGAPTRTYPTLVLRSRDPYNNEEIVRFIVASLRPYEGENSV